MFALDVIVGVNKHKLDHEDPVEVLQIDNTMVREQQIRKLQEIRAKRNKEAVKLYNNIFLIYASLYF